MVLAKCFICAFNLGMCIFLIARYLEMANNLFSQWDYETVTLTRSSIYDMYLKKFNKSYSDEEYKVRLKYFRNSMKEISVLNNATGATHGWTKFTDMSKEELSRMVLKRRDGPVCYDIDEKCVPNINDTVIPDKIEDKVDYRTRGAIGPVLDQLLCACCWAISIVGNMEAMAVLRGFSYQQFSVQEFLTCSTAAKYTKGCSGGSMAALTYLCKRHLALTTEEECPLTLSSDGACQSNLYQGVRRLKRYTVKCDMNEDYLLRIISNFGPVVVVVNSAPLLSYNNGVIQSSCQRSHDGSSKDHMVQIVGYDLTAPVPYYIVKNSWGPLYGEGGYLRLAVKKNMCGLADEVAYFDVY